MRTRRRLTLRTQVAVTVAAAVMASTVVTTYAAYELERSGTRDRFTTSSRRTADSDAAELTDISANQRTSAGATSAACNYFSQSGIGFAVFDEGDSRGFVVFNGGNDACDNGPLPDLPEATADAQGHFNFWVDDGQTWATDRLVTTRSGVQFGITEFFDYRPELSQLRRLRDDLLLVDALAVLVAVLLGLTVANGITRPVTRVTQAFRLFGAGDLTTRIPERGSAELAALARDFNALADQLTRTLGELRASQTLQQRFVADVSHELRTPLAVMVAANEGLDSADAGQRARAATLVQDQTRRMGRMIEDLLEMSRFDAGQATLELEPVALDQLAEDVVRTVAPDDGVRVLAFGDVIVDVDARRMHALLRNLVSNALQHGAPPVDVVIDGRGGQVSVTVADDGPGVPPELVPTVFDRFVRADSARSGRARASASTGLGLSIAAENARLHGATLDVSTSGRSAFTLRLPRRPADVTD